MPRYPVAMDSEQNPLIFPGIRRHARCLRCALSIGVMALASFFAACGGDGPDRPEVIATYPARAEILDGALSEIRVHYDRPVEILRGDLVGVAANGVGVPVFMRMCPDDPSCILIRPLPGEGFPPNEFLTVAVGEGAVVAQDGSYALDRFAYNFTSGTAPDIMVGSPGTVSFLNADTLTLEGSIATPAGRDPVGIVDAYAGTMRRIWVQLNDGDGTGTALAYFAPGDAAMTPVTLSTEGGLGDLSASADAIVLGPDGVYLYAAYRDDDEGMVRVFKIDVEVGDEVAAILLSIPMDGASEPLGMVLDANGEHLLVSCEDGATGQLAFVELETFTEVDQDDALPDVQAFVLPEGAGPIVAQGTRAIIGHNAHGGVTLVDLQVPSASVSTTTTTASAVPALTSTEGAEIAFVGLAGFASDEALDVRTLADGYSTVAPVIVIDDTAGGPTGIASVTAMGRLAFPRRFLFLFDNGYATTWTLTESEFLQEDLDAVTDDIQGVDLSATVPGITTIGSAHGIYPP